MTQYGISDIQTRVHTLVYQAGTESGQHYYQDMVSIFRVLLPFFQKWTDVPADYDDIYQQAKREMQQPDFVASYTLLTAWGRTPVNGSMMHMR